MKVVGLNLLLYVVDRRSFHHQAALRWWTNALQSCERIGIAWAVASGFMRLATSPRVFPKPRCAKQALDVIDAC